MTGVSRVQAPHVWEQYCLRRAIVASETDDGDANERLLWHGTPVPQLIVRDGFDPRVCRRARERARASRALLSLGPARARAALR